jgi:hypothetical protein
VPSSLFDAISTQLLSCPFFFGQAGNKKVIQIKALTKGEGVNVKHEPLFIFLLRDGTFLFFFLELHQVFMLPFSRYGNFDTPLNIGLHLPHRRPTHPARFGSADV